MSFHTLDIHKDSKLVPGCKPHIKNKQTKKKLWGIFIFASFLLHPPPPTATKVEEIFLPSNYDNNMITPPRFSIMALKRSWHVAELKWKLLGSSSLL